MKKISFIFIFLTILFTVSIVNAEEVNVITRLRDVEGYTGETVSTEIIVQNSQSISDEFSVDVWPAYWNGISVVSDKPRIKISANSNETVKLYFSIPRDADEMIIPYNITVKSVINKTISTLQIINLKVKRTVPIYISEVKAVENCCLIKPGESVKIEILVSNSGNYVYMDASLNTKIKKDDIIFKEFDDRLAIIQGKSTQSIEHVIEFGKYAEAGKYYTEVFLKDVNGNVVSKRTSLSPAPTPIILIQEVANVVHEKTISYGLLLQTITIKVKNEGNVPTTSFYVTEDIPTFMKAFFQPSEQTTVEVISDRIYYHWLIQDLMPGETRTVMYQINLWNAWAISLILIIAIIIAFRVVYVPGIVKGFRHAGPITREKQIQISLDVKNRSIHEIKDVVVRDFVPPIAKVVDRFDTVRPMVRRIGTGTEVIWKFDSLKPREERVLTYWIVPSVDIPGALKLAKAYMKFVDRKKVKRVSTSKSIIIKSR